MALSKQLSKIRVQLENETEEEAIRMVLDIHEKLVTDTPVDTGWSASNWLLSTGKSITRVAGSKEKISIQERSAGAASILSWTFSKGAAYDTNNVPYIQDLNDGSSKQAPRGFVQLAIQAAVETSNRKKLG